ncbi:MAG: S8 family serine peptidase [Chloroflexota bacterium]
MPVWLSPSRTLSLSLAVLLLVLAPVETVAAAPGDAGESRALPRKNYIVTLDVVDAGKAIRPSSRSARQRIRRRALQTDEATDQLSRQHGFKVRHRYSSAVSGFSVRLTPQQAARLRRDAKVASIRPARRYKVAGQIVPLGIKRVGAAPQGAPGPDTDVDIAILDTGIGPVGGGELNVRGGINCSGDGLAADAWQDLYSARHGTHVAGIAAARDNGIGAIGVAPGARLWSVRVFKANGFGDESTIICGLDWAVSTRGPGAPAGTQPIDVINMSIQGPRISDPQESCGGSGDPDAMHQAVCAAYAAGITMVVAAGNDASNAARVSPAGYDQVITVGALSDFDGLGGGAGRSDCEFYEREKDDGYARYSNYGDDVDIVAPGTCVTSTFPSDSGNETRRMTGTSMATPHVTGAVALYLAAHPGTSPAQMRKLVRASGRLDWKLTSDPNWYGPNDPDAPNRVLDVKALMGSPGLRTWIYPARIKVGGSARARNVRVDVQRKGGYAGDIQLSLDGLPQAVGSSSFDRPGASLPGLGALGARLRLSLKASGPGGAESLDVRAKGPAGNPSGGRGLSLVIDRTGPEITAQRARFRGKRAAVSATGKATIILEWKASDALSKVRNSALQRRIGGKPWKTVGPSSKKESALATVKPSKRYRFRVRSSDTFGNVAFGTPVPVRMTVLDSASPRWLRPASSWSSARRSTAIGGSVLLARKTGRILATTVSGSAIAIVAPVGPKRGVMRVRVDGGPWTKVSLKASKAAQRRVVFNRRYRADSHTVEIKAAQGKVAIDAILVID